MVAFPGCRGIAVETWGPCCSEGKIPAAAHPSWGSRVRDLGRGWVHSQLCHSLLRRRPQGDCRAVKHPLQQDRSPPSLLSHAREGMSLKDPAAGMAACHTCTPRLGAAPASTGDAGEGGCVGGEEGSRERGRETPVGNLPGLRDTSPEVLCSIEGHFCSSGGGQQQACGSMVDPSGSLLPKTGCSLPQPHVSRPVSHHRLCPAVSSPTSCSTPSFLLGFQPLWGADGAAAGAWQHLQPGAAAWGPPSAVSLQQSVGCCGQHPASPTHSRSGADPTVKQSRVGVLFSHLRSCRWGAGEAPGALNRVWKHLHSAGWEGAAGRPGGCAGLGREGAMSGAACVVGMHDLAQPSFPCRC